jgi:hypothetical protein
MGFSAPRYKLKWAEGHTLHGFEVSTAGLSIAELQTVSEVRNLPEERRYEGFAPLAELFADKLISWNYEDEKGNPVPPNLTAVLAMDIRIQIPMLLSWMQEVSSIPDPLPVGSPSGKPFQVELPPMDLPSPNLMNSPTPD